MKSSRYSSLLAAAAGLLHSASSAFGLGASRLDLEPRRREPAKAKAPSFSFRQPSAQELVRREHAAWNAAVDGKRAEKAARKSAARSKA